MIWIDFGVICLGQTKPSIPPGIKSDDVDIYERTAGSKPIYGNETYHFNTADSLTGYWYNIWLPEEIRYDESIFDIAKDCPWIYVVPKYKNMVRNALEFYLNESPAHKIAVLFRIEDDSNDTVHSICKLDEFINSLVEGNIRFNELYFIEE